MKLVIMTKPTFFVEEDKILASLFDEGLDYLHLCKPKSTPMYSERLLTLLPEDYYGRISVHDHFYLKEEYHLRGIHIDSASVEPPIGYKGRISRTCHSIGELKEAKKKADYVFLDGVFGQHDSQATFTADELVEAARRGLIDKKVYAMGGVTLENAHIAKEIGFGGVVVCEDLWSRFDIHNGVDFKNLMAHFDKLRNAIN